MARPGSNPEFVLGNSLSDHCSKENSSVKGELINMTQARDKEEI